MIELLLTGIGHITTVIIKPCMILEYSVDLFQNGIHCLNKMLYYQNKK